jgi:hypothetical protein
LGTFAEDLGEVVPISSSSREIIYAKISMAGITGPERKEPQEAVEITTKVVDLR